MDPEQNKKCEIIIITIIITITIIIIIYYIQADDFIDWHGSCCQLCNHAFPVSVVLCDRSRRAELSWAELEQQKRSRLSRADVAETASVLYIHTHTYIYLNIYIHIYTYKQRKTRTPSAVTSGLCRTEAFLQQQTCYMLTYWLLCRSSLVAVMCKRSSSS